VILPAIRAFLAFSPPEGDYSHRTVKEIKQHCPALKEAEPDDPGEYSQDHQYRP